MLSVAQINGGFGCDSYDNCRNHDALIEGLFYGGLIALAASPVLIVSGIVSLRRADEADLESGFTR